MAIAFTCLQATPLPPPLQRKGVKVIWAASVKRATISKLAALLFVRRTFP